MIVEKDPLITAGLPAQSLTITPSSTPTMKDSWLQIEAEGYRSKGETAVAQSSTNFYATNFELGSISSLFIHQLSRIRWRIDTEVFPTLTTDCHLKPPAVHQTTALVVLT